MRREGNQPPPPHLRDANYRGAKELGHGEGYKYPHAHGGWVEQQYLPDKLSGRRYYVPIRGVEAGDWRPASKETSGGSTAKRTGDEE